MRERGNEQNNKRMTGNRINVLLLLAYCCCLLSTIASVSAANEDETELPSIWQLAYLGTYHALYQLELANSDQVLTFEEWASYNQRQFRLDLVGSKGRTSYLTNGATGELLRYQPFVCEQIDGEKSKDLGTISQFFFGYNWDEGENRTSREGKSKPPPVLAYGLGPLWLRASKDAQKITRSSLQAAAFAADYDEFEVTMKPDLVKDQFDYKVRFYFVKSETRQFVDFIDWVGEDEHGQPRIQARARVIQVNHRAPVDVSVFEIPVGYGCPRRPDLDLALDIDVGLQLLHVGAPNQVTFEVITSQPESSGADSAAAAAGSDRSHVDAWTSSRYSMRMMRMSKDRLDSVDRTESYFASLMQFRDSQPQPGRAGRLRRIKRVWWAPDSERGQATVYTIDLASGECSVDHQDVRGQILLNFGGSSLAPEQAEAAAATGEQLEAVLAQGPMVLSVEQISFLFADNQDYHLIHLGETYGRETTSRVFYNRVYEKRVRNFQLASGGGGGTGAPAWKGPVSIIKQLSTYSHLLDTSASKWATSSSSSAPNKFKLSSDYRQRVTLMFYSEDQSKLMFKAVIDLLDNHEVSLEYAHEQLDVSSCFESTEKQSVVVKYPLESAQVARELQEKQAVIRNQVFVKLFSHLSSAFSSLQIYGIEPTFDVFNMRLQLNILDMPLSQTFEMHIGSKLVETTTSDEEKGEQQPARVGGLVERTSESLGPAIVQTTSSNADACADHCEHYNCLRFSYDLASRACQIELIRERTKTLACATCQLFSYLERRETRALARELQLDESDETGRRRSDNGGATSGGGAENEEATAAGADFNGRAHFSADSIVEYLSELVDGAQISSGSSGESEAAEASERNPLVLTLDLAPDFRYVNDNEQRKSSERNIVTLRPSVLEHDLENMQEYARELEEEEGEKSPADADETRQVVRVSGRRSMRLQFLLLFENRILDGHKSDTLEGVTYEECERHCETNDCRSFSYCQRDEICTVKWAHQTKAIEVISKEAPRVWQCNVYLLDYMSKFEPYGRALAPLRASDSSPARSARDCASACMDAQNYQCQGFYFCQFPQQPGVLSEPPRKCYMIDTHVNSMLEHERTRLLNPADVSTTTTNNSMTDMRECSFYSRSYLAQFDKYFARQIDLDKADEMGLVTIKAGHDLELCAKHCIRMTSGCLGFDACPYGDSGGSAQMQCHLAVKSIRGSQLKRAPRCTTFILSDKSHFNSRKLKLIHDDAPSNGRADSLRADREANIGRNTGAGVPVPVPGVSGGAQLDVNGRELELLENYGKIDQDAHESNLTYVDVASHWLAKFCSLVLGVALGFGFILGWNEAYARGWIDRARTRIGLL